MGFGGSFSKLLEKLKNPAAKRKRKTGRRDSSVTGEKVGLASPITPTEPHVIAKGEHDKERKGTMVKGSQSTLHPDVEVEVERGLGRGESGVGGEKIVDPPTPTPSVSHNEEPDSM